MGPYVLALHILYFGHFCTVHAHQKKERKVTIEYLEICYIFLRVLVSCNRRCCSVHFLFLINIGSGGACVMYNQGFLALSMFTVGLVWKICSLLFIVAATFLYRSHIRRFLSGRGFVELTILVFWKDDSLDEKKKFD